MSIPRPRTVILLGVACWMLFSAGWAARRWWAFRILEKSGLSFELDQPSWLDQRYSQWAWALPMTHLDFVFLEGDLKDGAHVAWAIRVIGMPHTVSLQGFIPDESRNATPYSIPLVQSEAREALACLRALGRQPAVHHLSIKGVVMSDAEIAQFLKQYPGLLSVNIWLPGYSAANFPSLPALQDLYFSETPVSDEGLAAVLRCPALKFLRLNNSAVTLAALKKVPQQRAVPLKTIGVYNYPFTDLEAKDLHTHLRAAWEEAKIEITRDPPE